MMPHASALEYTFFVFAFTGWSCMLLNVADARFDFLRFRSSPVAQQRFMTRIIYISTRFILAAHFMIVVAAFWALLTAPPPPDYSTVPQTYGSLLSLTIISFLLTVHAILGRRWRRKLSLGEYNGTYPIQRRRSTDVDENAKPAGVKILVTPKEE